MDARRAVRRTTRNTPLYSVSTQKKRSANHEMLPYTLLDKITGDKTYQVNPSEIRFEIRTNMADLYKLNST